MNQLQKRRIRAMQVKVTKIGVQMIEDEIVGSTGKVDQATLDQMSLALTSKLTSGDTAERIDVIGRAEEDHKTFEADEEEVQ